MTCTHPIPPRPRRFRAAVLSVALLLAGAVQTPALHASGRSGPSRGGPGFPSEAGLRQRVQDSVAFRAQVANAAGAYLEASDAGVDPRLERQPDPEAEVAHARCGAALERILDAGFRAWDEALEEYLEEGGSAARVEAYRETALEPFIAWLEEAIVSSVVAQATAETQDHGV